MPRSSLLVLASLALAPLTTSCGDDASPREVSLSFQATVGGQPASCSTVYTGLGSSGAQAQLADARLFVSRLEARNSSGVWVSLELAASKWQSNGVSLLDFEDATGACADSGTTDTNSIITGSLPAGDYDAVRFQVGIPFELNHVDNTTAAAPFNVPGMFWTWQGGYKFLRVDWMVEGGVIPRWNVHLGSTGCASSGPTEAPGAACSRLNATTIEVSSFDLDANVINIDLGALVASADLKANTADSPPGCMSSPAEPGECAPVFSSLGMTFADGKCVDACAGQTTFSMMQ